MLWGETLVLGDHEIIMSNGLVHSLSERVFFNQSNKTYGRRVLPLL